MKKSKNDVVVRALHTVQGEGLDVYAFFIQGSEIAAMADISRIERDGKDEWCNSYGYAVVLRANDRLIEIKQHITIVALAVEAQGRIFTI